MSKTKRLIEQCIEILGSNVALARMLGANERTIYRWLSGESKPSADYMVTMYDFIIKNSKDERR